jgi:predicted nucleotidyltransferase
MTPVSPPNPRYPGLALVTSEAIDEAVRLLVEASNPTKVILFGSHARGEATEDSDADFLIILSRVKNRAAEMARLRELLRPLRIPVDIVVASEQQVFEWGHLPGLVLHEALTEGKVLYEAS